MQVVIINMTLRIIAKYGRIDEYERVREDPVPQSFTYTNREQGKDRSG